MNSSTSGEDAAREDTHSSKHSGSDALLIASGWCLSAAIRTYGAASSLVVVLTLADFRPSTAVEAIAGEATPAALAHAMGNTLSASNALFATYCPVNLTSLRDVMEARRRGRRKLR